MEYKQLLIALSNFSKAIATNKNFDKKNINQIITSINSWRNSFKTPRISKYKVGDIHRIEFGLAYKPEMAFEHRAIIIGKKDSLYYVVPITSKNPTIHKNPYHPIHNIDGDTKYFLLKASEYNFLDHDSVIKCNNIKTVSYLRVKTKVGHIDPNLLNAVKNITFKNTFPTIDYDYNKLIEENKMLKIQIDTLKSEMNCDTSHQKEPISL